MIEIYSARRSTSTSDKNLKFLMAALSNFLGRAACFYIVQCIAILVQINIIKIDKATHEE